MPYNKTIKQENLQLAVFTAFNILANYKFPLIEALYAKEAQLPTHHLVPKCGWKDYSNNVSVSEFIYDELIPLVNSGEMDYENFIVGSGEFSDDSGYCSMEFVVPLYDEEIEELSKLQISYDSKNDNIFASLDTKLRNKFELIETL